MIVPVRKYSLDFIQSMLSEESGRVSGWINDLELRSIFQPTFSLPHKRAIGFEANLRGADSKGKPISPQHLFGPVQNFAEASMLDMLCATVHVQNYFKPAAPHGLLLINLHPDVLLDYGSSSEFLAELLRHNRIPAGRVMIDIPGSALGHADLNAAVAAYRQAGCLIAVDDFGVDNANLDTIWQAAPTMVKFDRSVIARATTEQSLRQVLPRAVSLLHEMGTLVLMEGIESESEALLALDMDADFGSGFYFGPAHDSLAGYHDPTELLDRLWRRYGEKQVVPAAVEAGTRLSLDNKALHSSNVRKRIASPEEIGRYREQRRPYLNEMQRIASLVQSGAALESSCDEFLALPGAIRCFALDGEGVQVGPDSASPRPPAREGTDFHALSGNAPGHWSRRDYFRRAVREPGVVQVTRQYCSLTGYPHCVTFSIVVRAAGKPLVVCGDVDWTSHATGRPQPG